LDLKFNNSVRPLRLFETITLGKKPLIKTEKPFSPFLVGLRCKKLLLRAPTGFTGVNIVANIVKKFNGKEKD
jgi:hypothetical protein